MLVVTPLTAPAKEPSPHASPPPSSRSYQQFGKELDALVEDFYSIFLRWNPVPHFFRREVKTGRANRTIPVIIKVRDMGRVKKMGRFS